MLKTIISGIILSVLSALAIYTTAFKENKKTAYISNDLLFSRYNGTRDMQEKLEFIQKTQAKMLDSLVENSNVQVVNDERLKQSEYLTMMSDHYTMEIWKQINQYITSYGKSYNYDFIYGATGTGNLMYAKDTYDITEDLIQFCNDQYEGNDQAN